VGSGNTFILGLNVSAPLDLFTYPKECVLDIEAVSTSNATIRENITLFFILSPVNIEMDFSTADADGMAMEQMEVEEGRDTLLYLSVKNNGNVNDVYDISLSGLSSGWTASFANGENRLSMDVGPEGIRSRETELIIIRCEPNSTDSSPLVIQCNSTLSQSLERPLVSKISTLNLDKVYDTNPIIIETDAKYRSVQPGENISVILTVTNYGSNDVSFKPELETEIPQWLEVSDFPGGYLLLSPGDSEDLPLTLSVDDRATANSECFLRFTGTSGESHGQVFDDWMHVSVDQVFDLDAEVDRSEIVLEHGESASVILSLENRGNGEEEIDIYPLLGASVAANLSERSLNLPPFGRTNVTLDINFIDTENATSQQIFLSVVSNRAHIVVPINLSVTEKVPVQIIDLAFEGDGISLSDPKVSGSGYVYVNFTVVNSGNTPSGPFTITVATENRLGSIAQLIMEREEESIDPGEKSYFSVPFRPKEADQKLVVELDSAGTVEESTEDNNIRTAPVDHDPGDTGGGGHFSKGGDSSVPVPLYVGGGGALFLVLIISGLYAFGSQSVKYSMTGIITPLYTKLLRDDILSHKTRERVYRYVKNNPGSHYRSILDELDLRNGTLTYHLKTLEKREFIVSKKDGPYRRFFPQGSRDKEKVFIHGLRKDIYYFILKNPGLSQKEISKFIKKPTPTVNYHVNHLANEGLVELKRNGRETLCFAMNSHNVQ